MLPPDAGGRAGLCKNTAIEACKHLARPFKSDGRKPIRTTTRAAGHRGVYRLPYSVPEARWHRWCTSAPDNWSVGFSRNASNTLRVWRDIRTSRSCLPTVACLH